MDNKNITLQSDVYSILEPIGKGGQANIWKVKRQSDGVILALKSVLTFDIIKGRKVGLDQSSVDNRSTRLQKEIDFLKSLSDAETHFIVPCLDSGYFDDPNYGRLPVWVMPIYNKTLGSKMPPYPDNKPIPIFFSDCFKWMEQAAIALETTHSFLGGASKFTHRDIKASNMMLTENEDIRLIDFGIMRETNITIETDTRSFSVESAAPEQVLPNSNNANKDAYAVGPHSDMYALGNLFYYLFTGKQPKAQIKLAQPSTFTKHIKMLDEDNNGLLGSIGGLNDDEYIELLDDIKFIFDEEYADPYGTCDTPISGKLVNSKYITQSIATFIRDLLKPAFIERPTASEMLVWSQSIKDAFAPELRELKLSSTQKEISANSSTTIILSIIGKGLPASANWVEMKVNDNIVATTFDILANDKQYYGFVKAPQTSWTMSLPAQINVGLINIKAKAIVGSKKKHSNITIKINESANSLWSKGKHQEALCAELKETWLNVLHQTCKLTINDITHHHKLLNSLNKCHPSKQKLISFYQKKFEEKLKKQLSQSTELTSTELWEKGERRKALMKELRSEWLDTLLKSCKTKEELKSYSSFLKILNKYHPNKEKKIELHLSFLAKKKSEFELIQLPIKSNIRKAKTIFFVFSILFFISVIYGAYSSKSTDNNGNIILLETELTGNNKDASEKAWKQLNILSKREGSLDAKRILDKFVEQTFKLSNSTNTQEQSQAFSRLQLIAKSGNKQAMTLLGEFYLKGKGGERNWGLAWTWFNHSNATSNKNGLEDQANKILLDHNTRQEERNLAYQVVEMAAKNEPAGHEPAQKWMSYRYRKGDGVGIDLEQAKKWDDIYNGIPVINNEEELE